MFEFLPDFLRTPAAFIIVLGVLIYIHELGHYLAARLCGVHVETFSIGFGSALASWTDRRGTVWKLAWIPLGGYVKLHGQERPEDVTPEVKATWQPGRTFHDKRVGARAIVVAAGPVANFLLAAVLFAVLFATVGRSVAVPVVGEVIADSAAARAGLQLGDRIEAIDGVPITRFEQIQRIVSASPGRTLELTVASGGSSHEIAVIPDVRQGGGQSVGVLGIRGGATEFERLAPWEAIPSGIAQTWDVGEQTLAGVWGMLAGTRGTDELGGPLRIAQLSGQVAAARHRQPGVVHRRAVGEPRVDQPVPHPGAGRRPPAVLPGRGPARPATAATRAGIRVPRRPRIDRGAVRVCDLERSQPDRDHSLGGEFDRVKEGQGRCPWTPPRGSGPLEPIRLGGLTQRGAEEMPLRLLSPPLRKARSK